MGMTYTAVVQQDGKWWIGWVEEIPGVNLQGQTREELLENLRDALEEALEMNRAKARAAANGPFEEVCIEFVPHNGTLGHPEDVVAAKELRRMTPSNEELLKAAKSFPPPPEWYSEDEERPF